MGLVRLTPSASRAVSADEVKRYLGIESDETGWDSLIADLIASAEAEVEDVIGRAVMPQTWALSLDAFADEIELPRGPVSAVTAVDYLDSAGAAQVASPTLYTLDAVSDPQWIVLNEGETWPDTLDRVNAVTITFTTGFAEVPGPIKEAIKVAIAARWTDRTATFPTAAMERLEPYRAMWIAA